MVTSGVYFFIFTVMSCYRWQNAKRHFRNLDPKLHYMKTSSNGECLGLEKPLLYGLSCSSVSVVLWGNIVQVCLNALWLGFLFLLLSCGIIFILFNLGPAVSIYIWFCFNFLLIWNFPMSSVKIHMAGRLNGWPHSCAKQTGALTSAPSLSNDFHFQTTN